MFVGPGDETDIAAHQALKPRNCIGGNRLIGVANVRTTIGIGNGGCNVEGFTRHGSGFSGCSAGSKRRDMPGKGEYHILRIKRG